MTTRRVARLQPYNAHVQATQQHAGSSAGRAQDAPVAGTEALDYSEEHQTNLSVVPEVRFCLAPLRAVC